LVKKNGKPTSRRMKNKGEILASILKNFKDCYFFLHNTRDFAVVENIMNEGFIFESQLAHSTDRVNPNEPIEVSYFLFQRKDYGLYTIIIAIPKVIYEIYASVSNEEDIDIEEVMTISNPYYGDNDELIYTLSPIHVLGYFNIKTSEFYKNRNWDPFYNNCKVGPSEKKNEIH
jgi:hypothetical protein